MSADALITAARNICDHGPIGTISGAELTYAGLVGFYESTLRSLAVADPALAAQMQRLADHLDPQPKESKT